MFACCMTSAFRKLSSIYVFSYFPFGFEGRIWDLIVSVPDHCLSFYFDCILILHVEAIKRKAGEAYLAVNVVENSDCGEVHACVASNVTYYDEDTKTKRGIY